MTSKAHILVPLDLSTASRNAVRAVTKLVPYPAHITLLHIYNPLPSSTSLTLVDASAEQLLFANLEKRLRKALLEIRRTELDGVVDVSIELECTALLSAASAICQFAENKSVDLIVLTTAGRTGLSRVVMGSVAEEVVRRSPCPVLVVRDDNYINIKEYQGQGAGHNANIL
jgi:nucleotide-binding universal stress UspA family protein